VKKGSHKVKIQISEGLIAAQSLDSGLNILQTS